MKVGSEERGITVADARADGDGWSRLQIHMDGKPGVEVRARLRGDSMELEWGSLRRTVAVAPATGGPSGASVREVAVGSEVFLTEVRTGARPAGMRAQAGGDLAVRLTAPMPGRIVAIKVAAGDNVKKGDLLLTLEAMKMQNEFVAPCDGRISELRVKPAAVVGAGDIMAIIAPAP